MYLCAEMKPNTVIEQRNEALRMLHKKIIAESRGICYLNRQSIVSFIHEQPAPRFYITPFTARLYINNNNQRAEKGEKQEMILDLIETYHRLRREYPNAQKKWLYEVVVEQPAKSFYMSKHRIEEIIFNYSGRNGKSKK